MGEIFVFVIKQLCFKELLSTRYGVRNSGPMGEQDRQVPCPSGA